MPKLTNTTDQPITAETGHSIDPGETITVSDVTMQRLANEPYISGQIKRRNLIVGADEAPEAEPLTRAKIARARKGELVEIIEAHGVDAPEGTADDMRDLAARIVFADL